MNNCNQSLAATLEINLEDQTPYQAVLKALNKSNDNPPYSDIPEEVSPASYLGLCAQLAASESPQALHHCLKEIIQKLGFTDYGFVRTRGATPEMPLITNPREQLESYFSEGFMEFDFIEKYAIENTRPIFLSKVYNIAYDAPYDIDVFRANKSIYELNQYFGYFDYYCIPMPSCNGGNNVMLTVAHRGAEQLSFQSKVASNRPTLNLLCKAIDYVTVSKFPSSFLDSESNRTVKINPKPLLVLNTLANSDKTLAGVADELCISTITANQHIAVARKALDAKTTVGAIKKAIKLGLIQYT